MNYPHEWLKYVDADTVACGNATFDGLRVESPTGENLGRVDAFIVDSASGRPYYVVVDAGGWFKSKHFLLPIGHAVLSEEGDRASLLADIGRDRIDRFPGFDTDKFDKLTPDSVKRLNDEICEACGGDPAEYRSDNPYNAAWDRLDYRYPDWWQAEPSLPKRMGGLAEKEMVDYPPQATRAGKAESGSDPSPHYDGRAQPGDVIGLETGGERTYIGDTKEDENKRREDAELAAPKK